MNGPLDQTPSETAHPRIGRTPEGLVHGSMAKTLSAAPEPSPACSAGRQFPDVPGPQLRHHALTDAAVDRPDRHAPQRGQLRAREQAPVWRHREQPSAGIAPAGDSVAQSNPQHVPAEVVLSMHHTSQVVRQRVAAE